MDFLAWYNLIFLIPLATGVLLIFGSMAGIGSDADTDADADHDVNNGGIGHEVGHDHNDESRPFLSVLSALGVGKVPLSIVLMILFLLFGGIGMMANFLMAGFIAVFEPFAFVSVAAGFFGAIFLSGPLARLLNRYMPSTETYGDTKGQMVGKTGTLELAADEERGWAQVRDSSGSIRQIKCRTGGGTLAKGTEIVVVRYDSRTDLYTVAKNEL
ncbi:DUF1449 family protein [Candidatus Uhrbacteria bacterium]|nr:DUF1449 family protein [Candidatus Uhrbacteria bacterium]